MNLTPNYITWIVCDLHFVFHSGANRMYTWECVFGFIFFLFFLLVCSVISFMWCAVFILFFYFKTAPCAHLNCWCVMSLMSFFTTTIGKQRKKKRKNPRKIPQFVWLDDSYNAVYMMERYDSKFEHLPHALYDERIWVCGKRYSIFGCYCSIEYALMMEFTPDMDSYKWHGPRKKKIAWACKQYLVRNIKTPCAI